MLEFLKNLIAVTGELYSEPSQPSKMEIFAKIVNGKPLGSKKAPI